MEQNFFEELQAKKKSIVDIARKATNYGWISMERQKEILEKLEKDVLTIGVIGQMKCGKSTFLNSFVFEEDVLPAATTPMTASLSVITYGENKKIVAEFYTKDEWEEQKLTASRSLDDVQGNPLEESKIKAAKELVEKAANLGGSLYSYLGKKQDDKLENLVEYVGADGKYIAITKSVTIYYPKDYLKGVEIVDTPGFNDPIVSREERTKAFLHRADVVLMMLYAGRPFDVTDREILLQNVRQCGVGKVIIGINKYDIPYEQGETENEIKDYVKLEINKACKECDDDSLKEILKQADPILLSAEMALLSELPMSKIVGNEAYQFAWKRACKNFEISNQNQMRDKSHISDLINAVKLLLESEKEKILFAKPYNAIIAAGNTKKEECVKSIREYEILIQNLVKPDDELEEKLEQLDKTERRLNKKINSLGDDIDSEFKQIIRQGKNQLEEDVDKTCNKMTKVLDEWKRLSSIETIIPKLDKELQILVTRTLKRSVEKLNTEAQSKVKKTVREFLQDAEDILMRYVTDFDPRDFIKGVERNIQLDIEDREMFKLDNSSDDEENCSWKALLGTVLFNFFNGYSFGALELTVKVLSHSENKQKLEKYINSISADFDPMPFLESINKNKDKIISEVKSCFIADLIEPMREQIQDIRSQKGDKESKLKETEANLEICKRKKQEFENQFATMIF